jgi:hypothetical protein
MNAYAELAAATAALAELIEAAGQYTYETIEQKRWIADATACETCQENEDLGWIDMDDVFLGVFGVIDDAPAHPSCGCEVEQATRRKRVYN